MKREKKTILLPGLFVNETPSGINVVPLTLRTGASSRRWKWCKNYVLIRSRECNQYHLMNV